MPEFAFDSVISLYESENLSHSDDVPRAYCVGLIPKLYSQSDMLGKNRLNVLNNSCR